MLKLKLAVFVCFLVHLSYAQRCDTNNIKSLCKQSKTELQNDPDKSYTLASKAFMEAKECEYSNAYYEAALALSKVYHLREDRDSVIGLLIPVLEKLPANAPKRYVAAINHQLSSAFIKTMQLEKGLKYALMALTNYELCRDTANVANSLVNIANVYQQQNNFKQADKYLREAEKKAKPLSQKTPLGNVYNTLGILYAEHSRLDSAEKFFLLSTVIREKLDDKTKLTWNYNNLGGLYYMQKKLDKASEFMEKAFKLFIEQENIAGQSDVANNLGQLYMQKKDYKKALFYYSHSRKLYALTNDKDNLENLYNNLSVYYDIIGDLKTAFRYSDSLIVLKDTLYGNRLDKSIAEMQTKYDTEKKDLELAKNKTELLLKEEETKQKNTIIFSIISLSVLIGITAFFIYRKKQIQQKAERDAEMALQKDLRARSVIEAEEKERIRIATDLHDGVGQLLSAAKLNLSSLESKIELNTPEQTLAFKNALELVDDSVKEVRTVSHSMMPNTLLKLGLGSAVKEFITKIQGTPNLKVNLEIVGLDNRLEQEKETVLYRVIQEVVANIIKHAKATVLTLQLVKHEKELSIMVEDNGVGFDTGKINDFDGIGLKNILSRVEFIGGNVHFDSLPGRGTTVVIEVPLT